MSEEYKPGARSFVFETLRTGQPRPYADHEYEWVLTVTHIPSYGAERDWKPNPEFDVVRLKNIIRGFCEAKFPEDEPGWSDRVITSFTHVGNGKFRILGTMAYTG